MFTREELEAIFNILAQRPFCEVAPLIGRVQQEYAALPAPEPGVAPVIDMNTGSVAA